MKMTTRKAAAADLPDVAALYAASISKMREDGIEQWDEIYPDRELLEEDIASGQMVLCGLQDTLASAFTLNRACDAEYETGRWSTGVSYMVVHRLCVSPSLQNRGIGAQTMLLLEDMVRAQGMEAVRLDAFSRNPHALRMYEKLGYTRAGQVYWRKGLFYLYEKAL